MCESVGRSSGPAASGTCRSIHRSMREARRRVTSRSLRRRADAAASSMDHGRRSPCSTTNGHTNTIKRTPPHNT
ncbi:jg21431 [Pararge aegeria aegeria]|uniref:Jg21431 protein n=1 Tax=Pararge aegeria aegeria TaxID=348720 RepID=A0A8S4RDT3_9NEOP|nr:jg21431 [Pararge aegeria aegeria]